MAEVESSKAPPEWMADVVVVLHRVRDAHLDGLQRAIERSHPELADWMDWAGEHPQTRETTAQWIRDRGVSWADGSEYGFAMTDPASGEVIGVIGLMRRIGDGGLEIGYWVRTDRAGRGVATAATRLVTDAALRMTGIERIEIHHDEANRASGRIPEKLGYSLTDRHHVEKVARAHTGVNLVWTVTREAWTAPRR